MKKKVCVDRCEHCGKKAKKIETKQATMACMICGAEDPDHIPFWSQSFEASKNSQSLVFPSPFKRKMADKTKTYKRKVKSALTQMTKSVREKIDQLLEINVVLKMSFEEIEYLLEFLKKEEEEDYSSGSDEEDF